MEEKKETIDIDLDYRPNGENPTDFFHVDDKEYPALVIVGDLKYKYGVVFDSSVPWTLRRLWGADIWYGKVPFCKTILLINIIVWLLYIG